MKSGAIRRLKDSWKIVAVDNISILTRTKVKMLSGVFRISDGIDDLKIIVVFCGLGLLASLLLLAYGFDLSP
jgi:hypothetical protein